MDKTIWTVTLGNLRYVEWPKSAWATHLRALLKGKALDVYALLPAEDALDYDKLKLDLY